jgi:hypothetical protein
LSWYQLAILQWQLWSWQNWVCNNFIHVAVRVFVEGAYTPSVNLGIL